MHPTIYKERTPMSEPNNTNSYEQYEKKIQTIQLANAPILENFEQSLRQAALSEKTVRDHVAYIRFFTRYLVSDNDPPRGLAEATGSEVYWFLADWFPRKALWCSVSSVKTYLASFKKFFKWMGETGLVSPETVADVLDTLKDDRDEFLSRAEE